jgi:hypothetical protein
VRLVVRDHDTHLPLVIDLPDAIHEVDHQTGNLHLYGPQRDPRKWLPDGGKPAEWRITLTHGQWLALLP